MAAAHAGCYDDCDPQFPLGQFLTARISRVDAPLQQRAHLEVALTRIRDAQFGIP